MCRELGVTALFHDTHYRVVLDDELPRPAWPRAVRPHPGLQSVRRRPLSRARLCQRDGAARGGRYQRLQTLGVPQTTDVVFVGNYGDGDRSEELEDYVFGPRAQLPGLRYAIYGVRYPERVVARLNDGLEYSYRGWLANVDVPGVYSAARTVLHVPRRQYVELLPGTPTIRVFEALACGACLISLPWPGYRRAVLSRRRLRGRPARPPRCAISIDWLCRDDAARDRIASHGYADHPGPPHLRPPRCRIARRSSAEDRRLMKLVLFGSSLVSAYWNGAATYYRGICKALHARGHQVVFVEPDLYERQQHRDLIEDPPYAEVRVCRGLVPSLPARSTAPRTPTSSPNAAVWAAGTRSSPRACSTCAVRTTQRRLLGCRRAADAGRRLRRARRARDVSRADPELRPDPAVRGWPARSARLRRPRRAALLPRLQRRRS